MGDTSKPKESRKIRITPEGNSEKKKVRMTSGDNGDSNCEDMSTVHNAPDGIDGTIIPVLNLLSKAESGGELHLKDVLGAMVLMHHSYCTKLTALQSILHSGTETRLAGIEDRLDEIGASVQQHQSDIQQRMSDLEQRLNKKVDECKVEMTSSATSTYRPTGARGIDVGQGSSTSELNIVIHKLPTSDNENLEEKINNLLSEGLALSEVTIEAASRKGTAPNVKVPGVVIARCRSMEDEKQIMSKKRKLT